MSVLSVTKGRTTRGMTLRRKKRSSLNPPFFTSSSRALFGSSDNPDINLDVLAPADPLKYLCF